MKFRSEPTDVGLGYSVTFAFDGKRMTCEWQPDVPPDAHREALTPGYVAARDKFLTDAARKTNISVTVIEL